MPRHMTRMQAFESRVDKTGECWLWTAAIDHDGYPQLWMDGKNGVAHRFAYATFVGPIPHGYEVDHLCRVRHCVNPAHLEAVTPRENTLRSQSVSAINARKTHCIHGHEFTEENTLRSQGKRCCRACSRARQRAKSERYRGTT